MFIDLKPAVYGRLLHVFSSHLFFLLSLQLSALSLNWFELNSVVYLLDMTCLFSGGIILFNVCTIILEFEGILQILLANSFIKYEDPEDQGE